MNKEFEEMLKQGIPPSAVYLGEDKLVLPTVPKAPSVASTRTQDFMPDAAGCKHTNPKDVLGATKVPMSSIPPTVLAEVAVALFEGSLKYGYFNIRGLGARASIYYDATMRHLMAFWEGEDTDPDSGLSHITKAISSLVVLRDAMIREMVTDDRPPKSTPFLPELNKKTKELIERYGHIKPKHWTEKDV